MLEVTYAISVATLIYSLVVFLVQGVKEHYMSAILTADLIIFVYTLAGGTYDWVDALTLLFFTAVHFLCWVMLKSDTYRATEDFLDYLD